jgi:predicted metal-binding membrane protein
VDTSTSGERRRRISQSCDATHLGPTARYSRPPAAPYLLLWLAAGIPVYALAAVLASQARSHGWLSDAAPYAVAAVLVAAGGYRFTAAKRACLRNCRSPLAFLATRWQPGIPDALGVGVAHAGYCLGCCWLLMVVLVAAGAMGLAWVLAIAALVLLEKLAPRDLDRVARRRRVADPRRRGGRAPGSGPGLRR